MYQGPIMNCHDLFFRHPEEQEMTYVQHLYRASYLGSKMIYGGICLLIHAIVPGFHEHTGTHIIQELQQDIEVKKIHSL